MNDINLLTGLYDKQYNSPFGSFEREWDRWKNKYLKPLEILKDHIFNIKIYNKITETTGRFYSFSAGLSDCEQLFTCLKISIYSNEGKMALFFDRLKRKIYKVENNKYEDLIPFSYVKYATLRYRPCIIQDIKVRFCIDFTLTGYNNRIILKLSDTVSCYDDDRRAYEEQLMPFVKTCKNIADTGHWSFRKKCSVTF